MTTPITTWNDWLREIGAVELIELPAEVRDQLWQPTKKDQLAAWELYTELRTRIASQPLHYMHGDEATALQSMADLFKVSRESMREGTPEARHFATLTAFALNQVVRPFTARWHKKKCEGALDLEDSRHEFREQLQELQRKLRTFTTMLGALAEGTGFRRGSESWQEPRRSAERQPPTGNLPFDIAFDASVPTTVAAHIRRYEHYEILRRRRAGQRLPPSRPATEPGTVPTDQVDVPGLPDVNHPDRLGNITGLAISGGGIRSATFALGAVQQLTEKGIFSKFDYLSTVSGGGYLGSFLSNFLNSNDPALGLTRDRLPFRKPAVGESAAFRHLRGHSKYLLYGGFRNWLSIMVLAVHGLLANAVIFWPLLAGLLWATGWFHSDAVRELVVEDRGRSTVDFLRHLASLKMALAAVVTGLLTLAPAARLSRRCRCDRYLSHYQTAVAFVIVAGLLVTLWNLIPPALRSAHLLLSDAGGRQWIPTTAWISGAVLAVQRIWASLDLVPLASKVKQVVMMLILVGAGPLFCLTLFLYLSEWWIVQPLLLPGGKVDVQFLGWLTVVPLGFGILFLDINQSSLHPFYRRKLSEAYLIRPEAGPGDTGAVRFDDTMKLSELRRHNPGLPYHLINAALNMPASDKGSAQGRGTDFFLFSQLFTGSAATGYFPTWAWEKRDPHLNLGTAMAISAAAASPVMGLSSIPGAQLLLTAFNLRLDYWLAVPGRAGLWLWNSVAGPVYLLRQACGWIDDTLPLVNVSDGGHIENLALYELLRRRCRFIVAIDGECDPGLSCGGLMRVLRFARIDFGIDLEIDTDRLKLNEKRLAPFHFLLGTIHYPRLSDESPAAVGHLLYLKLSVTGNEPPHVRHYGSRHVEFPHESTADQFFDEEQFEAYRALGYHAAGDLFRAELLGERAGMSCEGEQHDVGEWFWRISCALRDPLRT